MEKCTLNAISLQDLEATLRIVLKKNIIVKLKDINWLRGLEDLTFGLILVDMLIKLRKLNFTFHSLLKPQNIHEGSVPI